MKKLDENQLLNIAKQHTQEILDRVFVHTDNHQAVIVYDSDSTLSKTLSATYHSALPKARFINFNTTEPD